LDAADRGEGDPGQAVAEEDAQNHDLYRFSFSHLVKCILPQLVDVKKEGSHIRIFGNARR